MRIRLHVIINYFEHAHARTDIGLNLNNKPNAYMQVPQTVAP